MTLLDIVAGVSLFAVFDGHGGKEVAIYCERHVPKMLLMNEDFNKGNYEAALRSVFLKIDLQLISKVGRAELAKIARGGSPYGGVVNTANLGVHCGTTANVVIVTPT